MNKSNRFSNFTHEVLEKSGWFPERNVIDSVKLPNDFSLIPTAEAVLKEFGNLSIGEWGAGIEMARSTIDMEPRSAVCESDRFGEYSELIQSYLYPLGEVDNGHAFLAIDALGRVFILMNFLIFVADDFDQALEKLLTGIRGTYVDDNGNW